MTGDRHSRRRLLAATGAGLATALAGCGYQPAGGEFDWRLDDTGQSAQMFGGSGAERWHSDGQWLFRIGNRSGMAPSHEDGAGFESVDEARVTAYGADGEERWSASAERQFVGEPAVDDGRVYLALEEGGVTALEEPPETDDEDDAISGADEDDDPRPRWTASRDEAEFTLHVADGLVVGHTEDTLVGLEADNGGEQFALEANSLGIETLEGVATASEQVWVLGPRPTADADDDPEDAWALYALTSDGDVRATTLLPSAPDWLEAMGTEALLGISDAVWVITADGEHRESVSVAETTGLGVAIPVGDQDRLYYVGDDTLEAVDVAAGRVEWSLEGYSVRGSPVADADGLYGQGRGPEMDACGLLAVTSDGEHRWSVRSPSELGCDGDCLLIDDRLVVVDDSSVYGFRTESESRWSVL